MKRYKLIGYCFTWYAIGFLFRSALTYRAAYGTAGWLHFLDDLRRVPAGLILTDGQMLYETLRHLFYL